MEFRSSLHSLIIHRALSLGTFVVRFPLADFLGSLFFPLLYMLVLPLPRPAFPLAAFATPPQPAGHDTDYCF